ncbi:hypothetical protein C0Q70_09613 [Pomacea canaliculata]|uniref:Proline iminopeptidase n=2 Tax=Pomacea canaliculata TaxID=400727 RepID=A0A2T7PAA9_POMCA|nr:uncharacterized protein LOC112563950 isoform X2 [Pomacea canaliculata]XP_025094213.1 uncharacterized protein LOC112563950 isoform X2 [Pomacea canaliculata]XP_025094214.1 uncharacterized protein LOC112563950 isoform X2 [Pomacea canaliculata]PVD30349.1 hypothetical protein C0Q70_09613 [Pomacea canaliculata]
MDMAKKPLRDLYPESEPYDSGWLQVSDIHKLSYQQYGNSKGKAAVFLHGGPGAGVGPCDHRFFDPEVYRVILFDQRGAGKSTPAGELKENTTWDLVEDIEKLRKHLNIDRWVVFGGSWGSALSLAYAQAHPSRVKALVLRGIFTVRRKELEWLYEDKGGACMVYPDCFAAYKNFIPHAEQKDLLHAYYRRLISDDEKVRIDAAKHYARWEMSLGALLGDEEGLKDAEKDEWSQQFSRIGCHYFINGGFFVSDTQLLDNVDKIRHIPATIVQGRYDIVCPTETAWLLHKCWPEAEFFIVQDAGHLAYEPGITSRLVEAADKYKSL